MRTSLTVLVAMLSMAAGAWQGSTAQSKTPADVQPGQSQAEHEASQNQTPAAPPEEQIILTGCLEAGAAPDTYLMHVVPPQTAVNPNGSPSTGLGQGGREGALSGTAAPPPKPTLYHLMAQPPQVDLRRLVGQRVEIRGTLDPSPKTTGTTGSQAGEAGKDELEPATGAGSATEPAPSPAAGVGRAEAARRVQVNAAKAVGGSCP